MREPDRKSRRPTGNRLSVGRMTLRFARETMWTKLLQCGIGSSELGCGGDTNAGHGADADEYDQRKHDRILNCGWTVFGHQKLLNTVH